MPIYFLLNQVSNNEMERIDFVQKFSQRLNFLLHKEGYASSRSKAGIQIDQLAKVAGVSYQMARKYALGMALPDYHVVPKIAKWLNVSSSWLLYGEEESQFHIEGHKQASLIEIEKELLRHILRKCTFLFSLEKTDQIANYITDLIYDISHLNADNKTILKIIDMMLSSASCLGQLNEEKRV